MTASYLGIDPGLNGGFAVVSGDKIRCTMVMPTITTTPKVGETKTEIDRDGVLSFLKSFPPHLHVVIEKQEAFRAQNIIASCTICKNYGLLLMALSVANLHIAEKSTALWHAYFGIVSANKSKGASTKEQAFAIAQKLYPNADFRKSRRSRTPHDGIVDAVLLANYCQAQFGEI